ncbi:MAG: ABC transporter ATP-binding protein [bacterium]|nr:ABC transporter ATP-binding protein [bacterium]
MISFKNVTKKYNDFTAVDNLSFDVKKGEIVGFIGPNGSGKTTTMKLISGIIKKTSGEIIVNDYNIENDPLKIKASIGYISDSPDAFLRLKGIEYLNFIADIYDVSLIDRKTRIEKYAKDFEIYDALNAPMLSYSHGMRQKLMIISQLIHEPETWILDEPTVGLDPKSSYTLKEMMKDHARKGHTVFFSTHILEIAEKLCDRVIIIFKGKKIYEGTLDELKEKYKDKSLEEIYITLIDENN